MMKKITALGMVIGMFAGVTGVTIAEETQALKHGSLGQSPCDSDRSDDGFSDNSQSSLSGFSSSTALPTSESTLTASESEFSDGQTSTSPTSSTDSLSGTEMTSTSGASGISSDGEGRGQEGDIVKAQHFGIPGLSNVVMEYNKHGKELRFKKISTSDVAALTDYSGIDFSKVTKLVFDGIPLDCNTIEKIECCMYKNYPLSGSSGDFDRENIKSVEFCNCVKNDKEILDYDYDWVLCCFAGRNIESLTIEGKIRPTYLDVIASQWGREGSPLNIRISRPQPGDSELTKVVEEIENNYGCDYNAVIEYLD